MFSIGLFSTYLPYVILAMFYGLYVGVHSIVKLESDGAAIDDAEIVAKTIFKGDNEARQDTAGKTCYYVQFMSAHDEAQDPHISQTAGQAMLPKPHEDQAGRSCYHPLFSRPPPEISL